MHPVTRWLAAAVLPLVAVAVWASGAVAVSHGTGYLSPLFAPDGQSVFAVTREASATIVGPGYEFFTPPAVVWLQRDRLRLVNIRLDGGRVTVLETFPPSPLEGQRIEAYHHAIFGVPYAHLRWVDAGHLGYEVAVTRHDTPSSRTFAIRRIWDVQARRSTVTPLWQESSTAMAGDEPQQLHGDLEVIAVQGEELMPCAIALLHKDATASALIETAACRRKYPSGLTAAVLAPLSRRSAIERAETVRTTYAALVERGRRGGLPEGEAMLAAGREMQRLGFYPKSTTLVAHAQPCVEGSTRFTITDEQFRVGLFPDIEKAIARPDQEIEKSMGAYITHRDYTTSQAINAFLDAGHTQFVVEARGGCWQVTIQRP